MIIRRGSILALGVAVLLQAQPASSQSPEPEKSWTDHTWVGSDGTRFHYVEQGSGTPVILLHGLTSSAVGNWFRTGVAQKIAGTNRVIALDLRGHGETGPSPEGSAGTMIADVIEFLDHLGIERAHIAGYSMGGATTVGLMREAPERFITAGILGIGVAAPADEPPAPPRGAPRGAPSPSQPIDLTRIDFPVIAINGGDDRPLPKTEPMWRSLERFTNVVIPGRGHMDAPGDPRFGDALARFIAAHNP
jgi:pimeloyl-ACP methyl ester carboxylesterase